MRLALLAALTLSLLLAPLLRADVEVTSPDGRLRFSLGTDAQGAPVYQVLERDTPRLLPSRLGLVRLGAAPGHSWDAGFKLGAVARRSVDTPWRPTWGERAEVPDHFNEITVDLLRGSESEAQLQLVVRAYDEGIAFRYFFPESSRTSTIEIGAERTEYNLPAGTNAFWTPDAQETYARLPLRDWKRDCHIPVTLALPDGAWLSLAEAGLTNYAQTRLHLAGEDRLVSQLHSSVVETSPWGTPWRVVLVAAQPGQLLEHNYLILNLNPPCEIADTSWIHPGKVMRETTLSTAGAKRLVDFAVEQGIDYLHFDAGWYGYEYTVASDATKVSVDPRRNRRGDLDLPEAIRYAKAHGRRVILYVNHRALERQLDVAFPLYHQWGVDGVKFGFVHTGSHRWVTWLHEAVKKAAQHGLVVDVHDNYRPTGFSRTYPNLLQQEGILGDEGRPDATQSTIYPFTRFIAGAADHTYCWNEKNLNGKTKAHQLALAAINFGPLQYLFWYDRPEQIVNRHELEFWKEMPTTWDDTRVPAGTPGEFIVVARRKGADWFVGAVTNTSARTLTLGFDFLPAGQRFRADIFEDGSDKTVTKRTVEVTRTTTLPINLVPSGGVALRLLPVIAAR
ncbi:glycoside hydrolase family 97 protein [Opitutus sp. ER46]|uniref:glycoside hydrolase family 97 protein n=1 Tax=Opitutus sp. ER46 TaxID=2161864 RepID=UPI000D301112|nr:glycoside hydrolase family 97 protein [Opitutus sp. ER46]PTX98395.1 alpha-glucosidase [Opitutus sp. ER46]